MKVFDKIDIPTYNGNSPIFERFSLDKKKYAEKRSNFELCKFPFNTCFNYYSACFKPRLRQFQ